MGPPLLDAEIDVVSESPGIHSANPPGVVSPPEYSTVKPRLSAFQGTINIFAFKRGYPKGGIL